MVSLDIIHKYMLFFSGNVSAYGVFKEEKEENGKIKGRAYTETKLLTEQNYIDHLEGKTGLGVIPIKENNTVSFSVIDVDDKNNYDHIINIIYTYGLPLIPFRSKSGGLHIYVFYKEGVKAKDSVALLQIFRSIFLLRKETEIFPKQITLSDTVGNWINLPYFNCENTNRFMYGKNKSVEDIDSALCHIENNITDISSLKLSLDNLPLNDAPPCLQGIYLKRSVAHRNLYLFSLGKYYKTKFGDDFETHLTTANNELDKPIDIEELTNTIIKSHKKRDYAYKCNDDPIVALCDKELCKKREFGVGSDYISELSFEDFIQYVSDPPFYEWRINGKSFKFFDESSIINQHKFRELCFRELHILPNKLKDSAWAKIINNALKNIIVKEIDSSDDISPGFLFREYLVEFLTKRAMAINKEQILIDRVYFDNKLDSYIFKAKNLLVFLIHQKMFRAYGQTEIQDKLKNMGGYPSRYYINDNNKNIRVWIMPFNSIKKFVKDDSDNLDSVLVNFDAKNDDSKEIGF